MVLRLFFILSLFSSVGIFAQQYIFGKVSGDSSRELQGVTILNTRTDEKSSTDKNGNYMIAALPTDELRFSRKNYERFSVKLTQQHFSEPLNIALVPTTLAIEEIGLGFRPTGNLKKDSKALDQSPKVLALNEEMTTYMKGAPTESVPKNSVPSAFAPPDFSRGQISLLGVGAGSNGGLVGQIIGGIKKTVNPKTEANYAETQQFYRRIRENIDLDYFRKYGLDDYQIDELIVYADKQYQLSKNFRKNFDSSVLERYIKFALVEYLKTHATKS